MPIAADPEHLPGRGDGHAGRADAPAGAAHRHDGDGQACGTDAPAHDGQAHAHESDAHAHDGGAHAHDGGACAHDGLAHASDDDARAHDGHAGDHAHAEHDHAAHAHGHGHGHSHSHGAHDAHDGHSHAQVVTQDNERRIRWVFVITVGYAVVQAVGGWMSGSLALIADSGHMVSDAAALLLALVAYRIARRAADATRTYGFHRVRVLATLANGAALLLLVVWIVWEAVGRIAQPAEVLAGPMLVVATIGLVVNLAGAWVLWSGNRGDGNLRGALLHVIGDLLGSVGAIAAAIGIMLTGWTILDPILSVLVAVLVVRSAWRLVVYSIQVLLQAVPQGVDVVAAERGLAALPQIAEAGHLHAWTLSDDSAIATVHVSPAAGVDPLTLPPLVAAWLKQRYAIDHVTVQVDPPGQVSAHG
ncbi:MAG TPA: cation diffusion facilitator family transporter [Rubrivivax sp.]|nr:cation diffusion facilitator family transporter [Rubrivivax sp.]